jgi:hypothetical protein
MFIYVVHIVCILVKIGKQELPTPFQCNNFLYFEFCPEPASRIGAVDDVDVDDDDDDDDDDDADRPPKKRKVSELPLTQENARCGFF